MEANNGDNKHGKETTCKNDKVSAFDWLNQKQHIIESNGEKQFKMDVPVIEIRVRHLKIVSLVGVAVKPLVEDKDHKKPQHEPTPQTQSA